MRKFSDFMEKTLACDAESDTHRYLLVDTSATRPTNIAQSLRLNGSSADLLTGDTCDWRDCASPVLLELPRLASNASAVLAAGTFFATWHYANCFTYIESSRAWSTALPALRARTEAVLSDSVDVLLRFYDARIFQTLMRTLGSEQRDQFLAFGSLWAVPGRHGELHLIKGNGSQNDCLTSPLPLTAGQEAELIEAAEVDAMVDLLLNENNLKIAAALPPEQYERIQAALTDTKKLNIKIRSDQVAYCSLYLELGPGFHEQKPWSEWLPDVEAGRLAFSEALQRAIEVDLP